MSIEPVSIELEGVTLGYGGAPVCRDLNLRVPEEALTLVVGPNGCGKSTVLRSMAGLLSAARGVVRVQGRDVATYRRRDLARTVAFLPQHQLVPEGIRVGELVARGRYPHQRALREWSAADEAAVGTALRRAGVADLAPRPVAELSGGQRQRAWIAVVLAQQTDVLLLDEPTTYLDLTHQLQVLDLCRELAVTHGRTTVAVMHDLNQACRYADHLVVMRDGLVRAAGRPSELITSALVREVFDIVAEVVQDPLSGAPLVLPAWPGPGPKTSHPRSLIRSHTRDDAETIPERGAS